MKEKIIRVRVAEDTLAKLKNLAKKQDLSVSWLVRKAIDEFLKKQ